MPAIVTHHLFADEIKNNLNLKVNDNYYIFAQSHDYLYFSLSKKNRILAHTAHIKNTQDYFLYMIKFIKDNNLKDNIDLISYLYGSLTHYILDSTLHPYIFYKSGLDSTNHRIVEKNIDKLLYEIKTKKDFKKINIPKEIIVNNLFTEELNKCINYSYKKTYNVDNMSKRFTKSIKQARLLFKLTSYDKNGKKLKLFNLVDKLFKTNLSILSTQIQGNKEYLNEDHNEWNHPCFKDKIHNYSLIELYNQSLFKIEILIKYVNKYLNDELDMEDLKNYIPNISYTTGLKIEDNIKMKYFENKK